MTAYSASDLDMKLPQHDFYHFLKTNKEKASWDFDTSGRNRIIRIFPSKLNSLVKGNLAF